MKRKLLVHNYIFSSGERDVFLQNNEAFGGELWVNGELCYEDRKMVKMPFELDIVYFPTEEDHEGNE